MSDLALFRVVFEGDMFTLRGHWGKCRITELVSEVNLTQSILGYQNRSHYRGKIVEVERLYKKK
jgi:hypothetical protein